MNRFTTYCVAALLVTYVISDAQAAEGTPVEQGPVVHLSVPRAEVSVVTQVVKLLLAAAVVCLRAQRSMVPARLPRTG